MWLFAAVDVIRKINQRISFMILQVKVSLGNGVPLEGSLYNGKPSREEHPMKNSLLQICSFLFSVSLSLYKYIIFWKRCIFSDFLLILQVHLLYTHCCILNNTFSMLKFDILEINLTFNYNTGLSSRATFNELVL